jgi:para-aminobenzoate synthetase component I
MRVWSDRLPAASRRQLVDILRRVWSGKKREPPSSGEYVWLDRPGGGEFAVNPVVRLRVTAGIASVCGPGGHAELPARGFDLIEGALEAWSGAAHARLFGYLGYELGAELEDVPHREAQPGELPDLYLGLYEHWEGPPKQEPGAEGQGPVTSVHSTPTEEGFCDSVARAVKRIYNGELFQVNLCRRLDASLSEAGILPVYYRLRAISPASYGALIGMGQSGAVLSVSPELFLTVRDGYVRSCPIKGTRPRGATPDDDRALADALLGSEKDRAELAMIVDVVRNDLGRVCRARSITVARHAELMTLPTVHHTSSEVTGQLRRECGVADLLRASFPPASISGAPKIRAMEVAAMEEGYRRGPCMGSIGWIGLNGDMELSVAIRTAVASQGGIHYLAGCGITAESMPEEELAESEAKAAAFLQALGIPQTSKGSR